MVLVTAMYPNTPGSRFDRDYYLQTHIPLLKERWSSMGLENVRLVRGIGTADGGEAPFQVICLMSFRSMQDFQSAAGAHAAEIVGDVVNFTDAPPIIQISEDFG